MENQHRHIKGYRDLTHAEIDLINRIKGHAEQTAKLVAEVADVIAAQRRTVAAPYEQQTGIEDPADKIERLAEIERLNAATPERWQAIARTSLQHGYMELVRSVAQPTTF